jgi:hypothetical protein
MIKRIIDYVDSRVTRTISEGEMEETCVYSGCCGPNFILRLYLDMCCTSIKFPDFLRLFVHC